jgi:hypothetical protein
MNKIPDGPVCERGNDLIAFLYGELDESVVRDFERHLLNCADCESELDAFKQIRSSVVAWRQESLGGANASAAASPAVVRVSNPGKPSAIAAIREFFALSPLWMKGSIAFASVLFCVVSVVALAHLLENRQPVVVSDKRLYTEDELRARVEDAVKSEQEREARERTLLPVVANDNVPKVKPQDVNQSVQRLAAKPKVGRRPLTKSEREQLAADLRLITPQDDLELDLLGDGNN